MSRLCKSSLFAPLVRGVGSVGINMRSSLSRLSSTQPSASAISGEKASAVYQRLRVGPMKRLYKYYTAGAVNLAGGLPMDSTFPVTQLRVSLSDGSEVSLARSRDLLLNYHRGDGLPPVKDWVQQHVQALHTPPYAHSQTCVTVGSTDAWAKILALVETDAVLFDRHAYGAAVNACAALGKQSVGVETDAEGMKPEALREAVLTARKHGLAANLVYFVPVGQNPTGMTISPQRKRELYAVCQELDVVIVEDDAYYYLYFDLAAKDLVGIGNLPQSFLSLDTDGRVLRLDSLSKFIAPGARIGWICGPADFIDKYLLLQEATTQFPSGFSQSVFNGLVRHWGREGLNNHVKKTQEHYRNQCMALIKSLEEFMPAQYCSYTAPLGGMFLWLTFHDLGEHNADLTSFDLFKILCDGGVICVPGDDFLVPDIYTKLGLPQPSANKAKKDITVRVTFAAASPEQIRSAVKQMADVIKNLVAKK